MTFAFPRLDRAGQRRGSCLRIIPAVPLTTGTRSFLRIGVSGWGAWLRLSAATVVTLLTIASGWAQGSVFTYQGRLTDLSQPANGKYDFIFQLKDAPLNGSAVGPQLRLAPVPVTNGLFTVTLDFGNSPFTGRQLWLEIGIRKNGESSAYAILNPLQAITATPYATFAGNAAVATSLAAGAGICGNGAGITNLVGLNIVPGTINSNQIAPATDAAYRTGETLAMAFTTPQQFGATGDGITDDTAALQRWLTDASVGKKAALLPPAPGGYYKITSELSISNGLYLTGAGGGKHSTSGPFTSASHIRQFTRGKNGLHLNNAVDSVHIDNVVISANPPDNYTNICFGLFFDGGSPDADGCVVEQVLIMGFGTGVNAASIADSSFRGCAFGWNGNGILTSGVANNITIESSQLSYNYGHQVYSVAADNLVIKGCDIAAETPGSQGVYLENNSVLVMIGCRFEDYSTNAMLIATTTGPWWGPSMTLVGTRFYNYSHAPRYGLAVTNAQATTLINCVFDVLNTDGFSVVSSALDTKTRLYSVPAQAYLWVCYGSAKTKTATMSDPQLSDDLAEKTAETPLLSEKRASGSTLSTMPSTSAMRPSKLQATISDSVAPQGLNTNLTLKAGMQLCISNGVIVRIK